MVWYSENTAVPSDRVNFCNDDDVDLLRMWKGLFGLVYWDSSCVCGRFGMMLGPPALQLLP